MDVAILRVGTPEISGPSEGRRERLGSRETARGDIETSLQNRGRTAGEVSTRPLISGERAVTKYP